MVVERTPTIQALRGDTKVKAKIPWGKNSTMMEVLKDTDLTFALVSYVSTQKISRGSPQADFMKVVFTKSFRYHLLNYK